MPRPRASDRPDSRARLLAAAVDEFAAHGLAGASLDRVARRARLNKAMVYYHFASKDALYRETLRITFAAIGDRVAAIASSPAPPEARLRAFVAAFVEEAARRPAFPRMIMRELVESGRHLNVEIARTWFGIPAAFFRILHDGADRGTLRRMHPLLAFLTVIGPVVLTLASAPARARVASLLGSGLPDVGDAELAATVQATALAVLATGGSREPSSKGVIDASSESPGAARRRAPGRRVR
jgi:AcrR family transcriptional regulator